MHIHILNVLQVFRPRILSPGNKDHFIKKILISHAYIHTDSMARRTILNWTREKKKKSASGSEAAGPHVRGVLGTGAPKCVTGVGVGLFFTGSVPVSAPGFKFRVWLFGESLVYIKVGDQTHNHFPHGSGAPLRLP